MKNFHMGLTCAISQNPILYLCTYICKEKILIKYNLPSTSFALPPSLIQDENQTPHGNPENINIRKTRTEEKKGAGSAPWIRGMEPTCRRSEVYFGELPIRIIIERERRAAQGPRQAWRLKYALFCCSHIARPPQSQPCSWPAGHHWE